MIRILQEVANGYQNMHMITSCCPVGTEKVGTEQVGTVHLFQESAFLVLGFTEGILRNKITPDWM